MGGKSPSGPHETRKEKRLARRLARSRARAARLANHTVDRAENFSNFQHGILAQAACQRTPPEIWAQIAAQIPRYHLRTWLFVSPLHRDIATRQIFHTVDIYFLEGRDLDRGLDLLEHTINDPVFASRVKSLRLHWDYEQGDMLDLILRIVKIALPTLKALRHFEWIGSPEMPVEMVDVLVNTHNHLHGLGLRGKNFDAVEASAFHGLHEFTFHMEDEDLGDIRTVLDGNKYTLKHLILGGPDSDNSLDLAFESVAVDNLTHLSLFGTHFSNFVLNRIAGAHNLRSLTLHGSFPEFDSSQPFATDIIDGTHTCLPHLESLRFGTKDEDEDLYLSVICLLRKRGKLRRLDLGSCSWDMVQDILPDLKNLRVLAVCFDELLQEQIKFFVEALPTQMVAIGISDEITHYFTRFNTLSYLRFELSTYPAKPDHMDFPMQTLRNIAATVSSLDFLGYNGKLYVTVRSYGGMSPTVELKEVQTRSLEYGSGVDVVSEDVVWL